jgi:hypothetical protein
MLMLTVQGAVILGYILVFRLFDPWAARVAAWMGLLWLAMVIVCLAMDCYLKAGICIWNWRWNRLQEREMKP